MRGGIEKSGGVVRRCLCKIDGFLFYGLNWETVKAFQRLRLKQQKKLEGREGGEREEVKKEKEITQGLQNRKETNPLDRHSLPK